MERRWEQSGATESRAQAASPSIADEHVYVGGLGETVHALDRSSGDVAWVATRDGSLSDSSPIHHEGTVYVGSGGGSIHAFDAAEGTERWRHETDSAIATTPLLSDGTLFAGRDDGAVLAVDVDGGRRWQVDLDAPIYADLGHSPAADLVYVATKTGSVHALATDTGAEAWSRSFGADVGAAAPIVHDDRVYFVANELVAVRTDSGQSTLATDFYGATAGAAPAVDDDRVYVAGANGNVHGLDLDGPLIRTEPAWTFETRDTFVADPVVVGDTLVAASLEGIVYLLDVDSGAERDRFDLDTETRSTPALAGEELYLGSKSGTVFSFAIPAASHASADGASN